MDNEKNIKERLELLKKYMYEELNRLKNGMHEGSYSAASSSAKIVCSRLQLGTDYAFKIIDKYKAKRRLHKITLHRKYKKYHISVINKN